MLPFFWRNLDCYILIEEIIFIWFVDVNFHKSVTHYNNSNLQKYTFLKGYDLYELNVAYLCWRLVKHNGMYTSTWRQMCVLKVKKRDTVHLLVFHSKKLSFEHLIWSIIHSWNPSFFRKIVFIGNCPLLLFFVWKKCHEFEHLFLFFIWC